MLAEREMESRILHRQGLSTRGSHGAPATAATRMERYLRWDARLRRVPVLPGSERRSAVITLSSSRRLSKRPASRAAHAGRPATMRSGGTRQANRYRPSRGR